MQIIIDISEEEYQTYINHTEAILDSSIPLVHQDLLRAVINGIPLPKGHGKLGDLDIILNKAMKHRENYMEAENSSYCRGKLHAYEVYVEEVDNAPTIIEADGGDAE